MNLKDRIILLLTLLSTQAVHSNSNDSILFDANDSLWSITLDEHSVRAKGGQGVKRLSDINVIDMSRDELFKAPCCNLGESFENNASVDVNYSDGATGAKTIQMLGLSGRYAQILNEGIPTLRITAVPFGLSYVPGYWMDGIQVSKGTGTVVNGYESITGQISYDYVKPIDDEWLQASLYGNSNGRGEINANYNARLNNDLSTGLFANYSHDFMDIDMNKDGFRDLPRTRQLSFMNRWLYHKGIYTMQLLARTLNERRTGGDTDFKGTSIDTTNYSIYIKTDRVQTWMKNGFAFNDNNSLGVTLSYTYHNQESLYGLKTYNSSLHSYNINAIYEHKFNDRHSLHTGASSSGDIIRDELWLADSIYTDGINTEVNNFTTGVFAQYTYKLGKKFSLIAGIRGDWSNWFGFFYTPKLNIRYAPFKNTVFRATAGRGHKPSNSFAEYNGMLNSSRNVVSSFPYDKESAWNFGFSATQYITIFNRELTLSAEYYRTQFEKQLIVDFDQNENCLYFYFSDDKSYADIVQIEAKYEILKGFEATVAWRWNNSMQTTGGKLQRTALTNRYKGLVSLSYTTPLRKWQFDANAQFCGGGRLPVAINGSRDFRPYQLFSAQITKLFRYWSIYAGVENISDKRQKHPVIGYENPFGAGFDATIVYEPLMGRTYYLGLRLNLERKANRN